MAERGRLVHVVSTAAASGKSVIVTGLLRLLADTGGRVAPFKPMAEVSEGQRWSVPPSLAHQCFAAGCDPRSLLMPVIAERSGAEAVVWTGEEALGRVPSLGRDLVVIDALGSETVARLATLISATVTSLLDLNDVVVSEGSSGCNELSALGMTDLANLGTATQNDAVVVVIRVSKGGAATSLDALDRGIPDALRSKTVGFLLNEAWSSTDAYERMGERAAKRSGIPMLGVIPRTDFFDGRGRNAPPSIECAQDHAEIARLLLQHTDIGHVLLGVR